MIELPQERNTASAWFALHTRARYESFVAKQVSGKGYEIFLPTYKSRRKWSDRVKETEMPLFPGYLFCRFDISDRLPLLMIPGVMQIVGTGKIPLPIPEEEMAALQAVAGSELKREPWPFLKVGQSVMVKAGPLCGIEGILLNVKGAHRLVISVTLLQRSVAVEVEAESVEPVPMKSAIADVSPSEKSTRVADQSRYAS